MIFPLPSECSTSSWIAPHAFVSDDDYDGNFGLFVVVFNPIPSFFFSFYSAHFESYILKIEGGGSSMLVLPQHDDICFPTRSFPTYTNTRVLLWFGRGNRAARLQKTIWPFLRGGRKTKHCSLFLLPKGVAAYIRVPPDDILNLNITFAKKTSCDRRLQSEKITGSRICYI